MSCGIDVNEILLKKALGLEVNIDAVFEKKVFKAAGYVCFYLPEGEIVSVAGIDEIKGFPFVKMVCLDNIEIGQRIEKMVHKGLRKGPILVCGENRDMLEYNIKVVQEILKIEVIGNNGIISGIVWE